MELTSDYTLLKKKNSEHENTAIETVQNQTNCKKKQKKEHSISVLRTTSGDQTHVTGEYKDGRE